MLLDAHGAGVRFRCPLRPLKLDQIFAIFLQLCSREHDFWCAQVDVEPGGPDQKILGPGTCQSGPLDDDHNGLP